MDHRWFRSSLVDAVSALAAAFALLLPAGAVAGPQSLDCRLTQLETKAAAKFDVETESRPITILFDEEARALTVTQDGNARALHNVTITQSSMNGYVDDMSLGIDPSSWRIVFQTYKPDSERIEFGACSLNAKPPP